ncbi:hypothetical protein [Methylophilus aquaticus]|uniref:Uncharacterized protein n=1 Tax=Methylophilus aquaticus TaxID=1971610 RepID=A0ABT9JVZ3_9PROT|nr:hypothetical protein [Methylophilus aquaticus]MDP8568255.1 hypothetical protein [Methylophilus aquaticus]
MRNKVWGLLIIGSLSCLAYADHPMRNTPPGLPAGSPPSLQRALFRQLPAGVLVDEPPEQSEIADFQWHAKGDFQLGWTDKIFMRGLVLSTHRYRKADGDDMAALSPVDVVIGWQRMSDPSVVSAINIRQSDRFYYWRVEAFPIPREEIELTSTNVHMIADNDEVLQQLQALQPGDVVSMEGYLTDVKDADGFIWTTSRVRNDHGDGACEILLVKHISLLKQLQSERPAP